MTSKLFYRELGSPNDRSAPLDWWWGLVAVIVMAALLWLSSALDERSKRLDAAYAQGQHDAAERAASLACGVQP